VSVKGSRNSGVQTMARGTNAAHHPGPLLTVLYLVLPAKTLDTPGLVQSGALMFCIMQNAARNIVTFWKRNDWNGEKVATYSTVKIN